MTRYVVRTLLFFGLFIFVIPVKAWTYWYYQQFPYSYKQPFWFYQQYLVPPFQWRTTHGISAVLYVEQLQLPNGYGVRVYPGALARQNIIVGIENGTLAIRTQNIQSPATRGISEPIEQFGQMSQWVMLPADADVKAMDMAWRNGLLEIFIPRR